MSHSCLANGRTDGGHGGLWKTIFIQKLKELGMSRVITHGFPRALFDCKRYYVYACINPFLIMPFNSLNIATGGL